VKRACHSERSEEPPHLAFAVAFDFASTYAFAFAVAVVLHLPLPLHLGNPRLQPWAFPQLNKGL
jgi:hypothetical protein